MRDGPQGTHQLRAGLSQYQAGVDAMVKRVNEPFDDKDHARMTSQKERLGLSWRKVISMGLELLSLAQPYQARRERIGASWDQVLERGLASLEAERLGHQVPVEVRA